MPPATERLAGIKPLTPEIEVLQSLFPSDDVEGFLDATRPAAPLRDQALLHRARFR